MYIIDDWLMNGHQAPDMRDFLCFFPLAAQAAPHQAGCENS